MRGSWRPNRTATYWPPHSYGHQRCVFLVLQACSTGGPGAHSAECGLSLLHLVTNGSPNSLGVPRAPSAGWWLSLPHLVSNLSDLQLTDFLSSPSYIIVQSPTQSLEWHVWSSSSGNNCHAVHRSLSSGVSVYECTVGFYLVPFYQQSPPTRFLLITTIGMCHFLPVHHFGMVCLAGSKVNIQHNQPFLKLNLTSSISLWFVKLNLADSTLISIIPFPERCFWNTSDIVIFLGRIFALVFVYL